MYGLICLYQKEIKSSVRRQVPEKSAFRVEKVPNKFSGHRR